MSFASRLVIPQENVQLKRGQVSSYKSESRVVIIACKIYIYFEKEEMKEKEWERDGEIKRRKL